jgi:hypothetical protein
MTVVTAGLPHDEHPAIISSSLTLRNEIILVAILSAAFACAFGYVLISQPHKLGTVWDWDYFEQLDWVGAHTIAHFHQFPFWNPYKCGGMPMLANPQSRILAPFFILQILFGQAFGFHLEILLMLAVGWSGGYFLARLLGLNPLAAITGASIYAGSSWFSLHLSVGHFSFITALYLPWIIAMLWHSMTRGSFVSAAIGGLFVAFTLDGGGVYQLTQAALLVGVLAIVIAIDRRSAMPLVMLMVFGVFAAGVSAVKLLPAYMLISKNPHPINISEYSSLSTVLGALLSRDQTMTKATVGWPQFEIGAYISVITPALMMIGIISAPRRAMPWLIAGAVFFVLAMGEIVPRYSPWQVLHVLPVFSAVRVSPRCLIAFTLSASVMAAFGIDFLSRRGSAGMIAAAILVALCVFDLWEVNLPNLVYYVDGDSPPLSEDIGFHQVWNESTGSMYPMTRANLGAMNCYEYTGFPTRVIGSNQPGYRGEQYLLGPGTVTISQWTPNALTYDIVAPRDTTLVVNQNFDDGWHVASGNGEVFSDNDLLAVRIPAGAQHLTLVYRDKYFSLGAILTMLTILAALVLWFGERQLHGLRATTSNEAPIGTRT